MPRSNLREKYKFKKQKFTDNILSWRGYCDEYDCCVGPTVFYNADGSLYSAGSFSPYIPLTQDRKVGIWKYYKGNSILKQETLFIK